MLFRRDSFISGHSTCTSYAKHGQALTHYLSLQLMHCVTHVSTELTFGRYAPSADPSLRIHSTMPDTLPPSSTPSAPTYRIRAVRSYHTSHPVERLPCQAGNLSNEAARRPRPATTVGAARPAVRPTATPEASAMRLRQRAETCGSRIAALDGAVNSSSDDMPLRGTRFALGCVSCFLFPVFSDLLFCSLLLHEAAARSCVRAHARSHHG